ncbi:MAG: hypothetical protein IPL87_02560 [Candidatus Moraniibacteriota bacterium]|nr:MAG: hypothetical protein IPL87_02560 [Candidatus Moranbacteria bacterium]
MNQENPSLSFPVAHEPSDAELVLASLRDPDEFTPLVRRYWDRLFQVCPAHLFCHKRRY